MLEEHLSPNIYQCLGSYFQNKVVSILDIIANIQRFFQGKNEINRVHRFIQEVQLSLSIHISSGSHKCAYHITNMDSVSEPMQYMSGAAGIGSTRATLRSGVE